MGDSKFIGKIEKLEWDEENDEIILEGYCFIRGVDIHKDEICKKSFILTCGKKKYVIKSSNILRKDIKEIYDKGKNNYDYSGFKCSIDLGFIDEMKPLSYGKWSIGVYINCNGEEYEGDIEYSTNSTLIELKRFYFNGKINTFTAVKEDDRLFIVSSFDKFGDNTKVKGKDRKIGKVETYFRKKFKSYLKIIAINVYNLLVKYMPIKKQRITMLSDFRDGLYGNFHFVYDELIDRGVDDIRLMLKSHDNMKKTFIEKLKIIYYLATSEVVLLDDYYNFVSDVIPRKGVKWVQLWHAPGAFKSFGFTRIGKMGWPENRRVKNHRTYTHAIVSSEAMKKHYSEAYSISEHKIFSTGTPRTDVFFDNNYRNRKIEQLYNEYPILREKKIILFAPTFRGKGIGGYYNFENLDLQKMKNDLGNEYVMIMKMHPFISNIPNYEDEYSDFIIDLSHEKEINDLLFFTDILITDYSSVCFEFSLLNRPMIFFAYDMDDYIAKRDFYYPYESFVPGTIVKTTEEIIDVIKEQKFSLDKLEKFRNKFFDHFDGKSSKRVVDLILSENTYDD